MVHKFKITLHFDISVVSVLHGSCSTTARQRTSRTFRDHNVVVIDRTESIISFLIALLSAADRPVTDLPTARQRIEAASHVS